MECNSKQVSCAPASVRALVRAMAVELVTDSINALSREDINRLVMNEDSIVVAASDVCEAASIAGRMTAVDNARRLVGGPHA